MANRAKKFAISTAVSLLLLLTALLGLYFFWLGPTVELAAEKIGSKALGTPLRISELEINPLEGTIHLEGFSVGNPERFGQTNAVSLAGLDIELDFGSLLSETVMVHRVSIDRPALFVEQCETTNNLTVLTENLTSYFGIEENAPEPPKDEPESPPKKVIIETLEIHNVQLAAADTRNPELNIEAGIEQISMSMTNGIFKLQNLQISNPGKLDQPNLFTLDGIAVHVAPKSIYSNTVSILDLQITRPYACLEHNAETDTLTEFQKLAESLSAGLPAKEAPEKPTKEAASPIVVKLHNAAINDLQLRLFDTSGTNSLPGPALLAGIRTISAQPESGRFQVSGIRVPNPEGFSTNNLMQVKLIAATMDPESLLAQQLLIENITIDAPQVNLEQTEKSGNVVELQNRLNCFIPQAKTPTTEPDSKAEPIPLSEQPVLVNELVISNFAVTLKEPVSTNESAWSSFDLLNPLNKLSLDKLNLLKGASEEEEAETAPDAPMTIVAFQDLSIHPLEGEIDIRSLKVGNPPGFTRRKLIRIDEIHTKLDPDSLQSDTLHIKDIVITSPKVRFERQLLTDNIKALQKEVEQATVKREESKESAGPAEPAKKVIIDRVVIAKSSVQAKLSIAPATPPIPLIKITLKDLGKEEGGATPAEASTRIVDTFYDEMIGAVSKGTGFATDVLKKAGGLAIPQFSPEEIETTETAEEAPVEPETEKQPSRSSRKRRHPGRMF